MVPIEVVGIFTKPFALAIRLFANMSSGHIILFTLIGLFSFSIQLQFRRLYLSFRSLFISWKFLWHSFKHIFSLCWLRCLRDWCSAIMQMESII